MGLTVEQSSSFRMNSAYISMRVILNYSILQKETIHYSKGSLIAEIKSGF